ncbi:MAG: hypothetical protein H0T48_07930 [Gemmatimonadaceae bacterium]|nr:hypothetical protein [Gemmatimonadaceae bacterium]
MVAALLVPLTTHSQQAPPPPPSAPSAAPVPPPPILSGTLFSNFQYRGEAGLTKSFNKFDLERLHLTFRMPAGDRTSVRITTDVFQQTTPANDAYFRGWVVRAKFAYLQYEYLKRADWNAAGRAGLIQTVFIEHEETFWPRWIATTTVEKAGYFVPGDAGIGTIVTLPEKLGEVYATITNGPSFNSRETDRFKDYSARLSLTPLSAASQSYLRTLTLTGWTYRGALGSKFSTGGTGQLGPIGSSLSRNRWGVFAGLRDPRLTLGVDYASRTDGLELGANTAASPRTESDSTGHLFSAYSVARPFQIANTGSKIPFGVLARWDYVQPNDKTQPHYYLAIAGITWDLSNRASVSLDYQEQTPVNGVSIAPTKTYFAHLIANF